MSYNYSEQRKELFTESGQILFLRIRDKVQELLLLAGAFRMQEVLAGGNGWEILACVDRLVELGEIKEIEQVDCAAQQRIFVKDSK